MSSVLHPVGPEPTQTYWIRRVVVLSSAILLLSLVIAVIVNGNSTGSAVQPTPPVPAGGAATPTLGSSPSASTTTSSAHPPSSSASQRSTSRPSSSASSATTKATPQPTGNATGKATAKATPTAKPSESPTAEQPPPLCDAAQVRVTLTGKQVLKRKKADTFSLSMINGSGRTCVVSANAENFELKIYSGKDRIWSTGDCSTSVKSVDKKLAAEQAVGWTMKWNGRRSAKGCKVRPEIPRPGTYFATAQLEGAKPVQLRMIIHG